MSCHQGGSLPWVLAMAAFPSSETRVPADLNSGHPPLLCTRRCSRASVFLSLFSSCSHGKTGWNSPSMTQRRARAGTGTFRPRHFSHHKPSIFCGTRTERTLGATFGFVHFTHRLCLSAGVRRSRRHALQRDCPRGSLWDCGNRAQHEELLALRSFHTSKTDPPVKQPEAGEQTNQ